MVLLSVTKQFPLFKQRSRLNPINIHDQETGVGVQLKLWAWVFIAVQITYKVQHHN